MGVKALLPAVVDSENEVDVRIWLSDETSKHKEQCARARPRDPRSRWPSQAVDGRYADGRSDDVDEHGRPDEVRPRDQIGEPNRSAERQPQDGDRARESCAEQTADGEHRHGDVARPEEIMSRAAQNVMSAVDEPADDRRSAMPRERYA